MASYKVRDGEVLCPRCKVPMDYLIELEKLASGERRITRYYRCPVCGTRIIDEKYAVRFEDGRIVITSLLNGQPRIILSRPPRQARRRPARVRR